MRARLCVFLVVTAFLWLPAAADGADDAALGDKVERLRTDVESLKIELRLLRDLMLQRLAAPPGPSGATPPPPPARIVRVSAGDGPSLGRRDAAVTIVEFSDYQCPFCRRFSETTLPVLKKDFIDTGRVRYVFRDFPLDALHPDARRAAEAAHCAGVQAKYWEMHDVLFRNQTALDRVNLKTYATQMALDIPRFEHCLDDKVHAGLVQKSFDEGSGVGIDGTPAFVIGRTQPGDVVEGAVVFGARPVADFRQAIERLLAESPPAR